MEFLRTWMLSVTAAALAGMLVHILAPSGGTKKTLRMVVTVFFLTAFFLPFTQLSLEDFGFSFEDFNLEDNPLEAVLESQIARINEQISLEE
ncbi:MAG: hypothetical protein FWG82_02750 [Oscillospiraceae bacterium]|nr:hypothetical protein [Oscillospiraceae bacterium]